MGRVKLIAYNCCVTVLSSVVIVTLSRNSHLLGSSAVNLRPGFRPRKSSEDGDSVKLELVKRFNKKARIWFGYETGEGGNVVVFQYVLCTVL